MGNEVNKIIIFGGIFKLNGIDEYMILKFGIKIRRRKGFFKIIFKLNDDGEFVDDFINVIGLVIRF